MAHGGKEWCASHIHKVLTNEKMKGDTRFQKTYNVDCLTKRRAKNKGELPQYLLKDSHPAIIDNETWECVQLELKRQKRYCEEHHISVYHQNSKEHPLSGKITCEACGCTFMFLNSKRVGEEGRKFWRCSSFNGEHGIVVEGRTFTPKPMALWSKDPESSFARYRSKHRKIPEARQMLCTDIRIEEGEPEKVFVNAWKHLVDYQERYQPKWQQIVAGDDILKAYRAMELARWVKETGHIQTMPYELMLNTLSHIEIGLDGIPKIVFLAGIRI